MSESFEKEAGEITELCLDTIIKIIKITEDITDKMKKEGFEFDLYKEMALDLWMFNSFVKELIETKLELIHQSILEVQQK